MVSISRAQQPLNQCHARKCAFHDAVAYRCRPQPSDLHAFP